MKKHCRGAVAILMIDMHQIEDFGRRIGEEFHPERVLLFGSYAYGTPGRDSDVDVLVIMKYPETDVQQSVAIRLQLSPSVPMDILVRSPEKIRERLALGDPFIRNILENGEVLYEASDS